MRPFYSNIQVRQFGGIVCLCLLLCLGACSEQEVAQLPHEAEQPRVIEPIAVVNVSASDTEAFQDSAQAQLAAIVEFIATSSTLVVELNGTDVPFQDGNAILNGVTLEALSASVPFQITSVTRDSSEVTLTWQSSPNGEYSVEYKASLTDADWQELDDGVPSEGAETSFTDDEPSRTGAAVGWYRIRKN